MVLGLVELAALAGLIGSVFSLEDRLGLPMAFITTFLDFSIVSVARVAKSRDVLNTTCTFVVFSPLKAVAGPADLVGVKEELMAEKTGRRRGLSERVSRKDAATSTTSYVCKCAHVSVSNNCKKASKDILTKETLCNNLAHSYESNN